MGTGAGGELPSNQNKSLELKDGDPYDYARAVRIDLARNGEVEIANGNKMTKAAKYTPGKWLAFMIDYDTASQKYSVAIDGQQVLHDATFAELAQSLQRISFRTGASRKVRLDQSGSGHGKENHYYVGHNDPETDHPLKNRAIYYLEDVWSQSN